LLHGWGSNREIWRPLLVALRPWANITLLDLPGCAPGSSVGVPTGLTELLAAILAASPRQAVFMGWSLGGQLAVELATREPGRVTALVTLCSNPRFVDADNWPGVAADTFNEFLAAFCANPAAGLRRFDSLQLAGSGRQRELMRTLRAQRGATAEPELAVGLEWLQQLDQRSQLSQLKPPQLHLLGAQDALVPLTLEPALAGLLANTAAATVHVLPGATHLAPLDAAPEVAQQVRSLLERTNLLWPVAPGLEVPAKKDVAASFSRAASQYDSVATLQRAVGGRLLRNLAASSQQPAVLLDLGCGTGSFRAALRETCPDASYIGLDIAPGMVEYARARAGENAGWLVGDAESLPLAAGSVDLIFSSLALQWCYQPQQLFAELARVLRPGGRCFFTSLGPGTLHELRSAWAAVDAHQHVNRFLPGSELLAAAQALPELALSLQTEIHRMEYARVGELLNELKTLGAHNMNRDRPAGLTSRKAVQGMLAAYEAQRDNGILPATYEVIYGEVHKV
jgi:malonyl-CoA O-methyltransferase